MFSPQDRKILDNMLDGEKCFYIFPDQKTLLNKFKEFFDYTHSKDYNLTFYGACTTIDTIDRGKVRFITKDRIIRFLGAKARVYMCGLCLEDLSLTQRDAVESIATNSRVVRDKDKRVIEIGDILVREEDGKEVEVIDIDGP